MPCCSKLVVAVLAMLFTSCATPNHPTNHPTGGSNIVIGQEFSIESKTLGRRTISVSLPMGYDDRSEAFPVVYLIDGGAEQDFIPVAGFGALATLSGQYREFIVVGIQTEERSYELTPKSNVAYDLSHIPHNGGADQFLSFIQDEVLPWVDKRYRTTGERAVVGESLAGLFIIHSLLRAPNTFDHYVSVSPSLWWEKSALAKESASVFRGKGFPTSRSLYLASADESDVIEGLGPLISALQADAPRGLRWWYEPMPQEHHHTIYHPATLNALRLIFAVEQKDGEPPKE